MSPFADQIQALAAAVAMWRMQESISISFFTFYFYYVLTTFDEEARISVIYPQNWHRGKTLFIVIRYGTCSFMAIQLARDYRNYYTLSMESCKAMLITSAVAYRLAIVACDLSLGLCLSALLQVRKLYLILIVTASAAPSFVASIFLLIAHSRYPAVPVSGIFGELGYPCYLPSSDEWSESTVIGHATDILNYINFATTALLLMVAVGTLIVRYRGHGGRLVQVLRRDGGLYFVSLTALRLAQAIINTPAVLATRSIGSSPAYIVFTAALLIFIPILSQRLLINLRKVDYMGSKPVASKVLFAPPAQGSEEDLDDGSDLFEVAADRPGFHRHQSPVRRDDFN